jgi:hypothetical protein
MSKRLAKYDPRIVNLSGGKETPCKSSPVECA